MSPLILETVCREIETDSKCFMLLCVTPSLIHSKWCFTLLERSSLCPCALRWAGNGYFALLGSSFPSRAPGSCWRNPIPFTFPACPEEYFPTDELAGISPRRTQLHLFHGTINSFWFSSDMFPHFLSSVLRAADWFC